jgi:D-arabinose 1-dehydrogenase-like Zn-dependent alcohol dehydrogenase
MLKAGGKLCFVGIPPANEDPGIQLFALLRNKSICGSGLGNRDETREML